MALFFHYKKKARRLIRAGFLIAIVLVLIENFQKQSYFNGYVTNVSVAKISSFEETPNFTTSGKSGRFLNRLKKQSKKCVHCSSSFSWKRISNTISVFSSYYDKRFLQTVRYGNFKRSVVVLGYEMGKLDNALFCGFIMNGNQRVIEKKPAFRVILAEFWKSKVDRYRAIMYRCNTVVDRPQYVTLMMSQDISSFLTIPISHFVPVVDQSSSIKHQFAVCYETPLYGGKYDQGIMDSIELNKALGATWFTIYVYEAHSIAINFLYYYSKKIKILDAVMNWGNNIPNPVYNRGLLVAIHDCVYRNMFWTKYLVLCDLDEVIMPKNGLKWKELMLKVEDSKIAHFTFQHLGFHRNVNKKTEFIHCPGKTKLKYKVPRFFATYNRSNSVLGGNLRAKSIAKPLYTVTCRVHIWRWMMKGYRSYQVPTNMAVMRHYRDKDIENLKTNTTSLDYGMNALKSQVIKAIERQFCENVKPFYT
ncbi:uncharacterized protein LOC124457999 [Xenia sp. Carnegie-2017]|uniref:uncharacterized protein LOC124457999 n=1 Tax=Xenia sp. Carnegie-2017 TaxID=2897299 RepID=UPI001F03D458|nr:uncharacterized protein LOC124457999 [Xenia sp. Carnegie-2017]XP_046864075.1 uncharacterized protein LOC124457999 [Xenia sp. Carnegie-2017]